MRYASANGIFVKIIISSSGSIRLTPQIYKSGVTTLCQQEVKREKFLGQEQFTYSAQWCPQKRRMSGEEVGR